VLEAGEHERLSELLGRVVEALPGRVESLALLVDVYKHTSDSFRLPDALIHLAEAYEAAGQLELAGQTYVEFLERDPENEAVRRKHERLQARLGLAGTAAAAATPTAAPPVDPAEAEAAPAPPPAPEENLDQETQLFIGQAITDVDLYSSYGLTQKALELLEVILQRAPDHPPALERLLDLSLGLNDDARAVQLASKLEQIYTQCGNREAADRFADLRRRFERAGAAPAPPEAPTAVPQQAAPPAVSAVSPRPAASPPMEFEIPVVDAQPEAEPAAGAGFTDDAVTDSVVHEVDLSEEWAALSAEPAAAVPPAEANAGTDSLLNATDESELVAELAPGADASSPLETEALEKAQAEEQPVADRAEEMLDAPPVDAAPDPLIQELLAEYERALDDGAAAPAGSSAEDADSFLRSLSAELDAVLPERAAELPARPPAPVPAAKPEPPAKAPESRGPLGEVFDEFRADMDEGSEREDPETHYNLGIAYREMGLMEEAISEFQKVASAQQRGQSFRYALQCYTLLALAFAEKGQPSIAVSWYERALQVPGLDPETVLALRYDLGVSQEMAGDVEAAHRSFSQVYGTNIDYRDVAERLAALERTR
jgi:tetratricopeptide (TPR) repeat protein